MSARLSGPNCGKDTYTIICKHSGKVTNYILLFLLRIPPFWVVDFFHPSVNLGHLPDLKVSLEQLFFE